jgi:hypothetical protein
VKFEMILIKLKLSGGEQITIYRLLIIIEPILTAYCQKSVDK